MTLTAAQLKARDGRLTASRVACLMTGDAEAINQLWMEMVGHDEFVAKDYTRFWPAQLGAATEALNLAWYAWKKDRVLTRQGEVVIHPQADWAAATLDAWDDALPGPIESKHVGGFEGLEEIVARYQPQLHWQMLCTGAKVGAFSIIQGAKEPVIETVAIDERYAGELWRRAEAFMECVWALQSPFPMNAVAAPEKAERVVDMTGNNEWADSAATWLETIDAKKEAEAAEKKLKGMVPSDAARCFGHGVIISRDRAGRLTPRKAQ